MPLDTAINNIGEYYAAHYLEAQFAKDIADPLKAWRRPRLAIGAKAPAGLGRHLLQGKVSGAGP